MSMNPYLAAMYNTHGAGDAASEEQMKVASLQLFAQTAAEEGIQLSEMSPADQQALYEQFVEKTAEEHNFPPKKDESKDESKDEDEEKSDEEKEAAARAELAYQQEWETKKAEADFLGRQMAHAFWDESREIEKDAGMGDKARRAGEAVNKGLERLGKGTVRTLGRTGGAEAAMNPTTARRIGAGTAAVGAGTVGAGGLAAKKALEKKKESSAFDRVAAEQAIKTAASAGFDPDEAYARVNAVYTLGLGDEGTKVAHVVNNYEAAVQVRGLEFLEAAGYPVDWTQVFGS